MAQIIDCYKKCGFGLWATLRKADNKFIGRCGLIPQEVDGLQEVEIGYMLARAYWGKGLAAEAARAIRDYGFSELGCRRLISLIDPSNTASIRVAMKNGMTYEKTTTKWEKPICVYAVHTSKRL